MKTSNQDDAVLASVGSATPRAPWRQRICSIADKIRIRYWLRYAVFLLFMEVLSVVLDRQSGLYPLHHHLHLEAPLLLALYWLLGFALRPSKLSACIAALPIVFAYFACDLFYISYGDVLRVVDAKSLPTLLDVLHFWGRAGVLLILGLPIVLPIAFVNYRRYWRLLVVSALALLAAATVEFFPNAALSALQLGRFEVLEFSDGETLIANGRLTTVVYFEASRRIAIRQTEAYSKRTDIDRKVSDTAGFIQANGNRRNVFVVVLESWVDPTLFGAVTFSRDPRHPDYAALVGDQQSFSISPVFGGETAQAEFEVLCGVPALQKISEIEFDNFTGHQAGCMPEILGKAGYSTYVSNAFRPDYFNSTRAYTGIGFGKLYFPREYAPDRDTYLSVANVSPIEEYLFDGDLFTQNLGFVAQTLHEHPGQPILNYVLAMYGHEPHEIDTTRRPLVLSMKAPQDDRQLLRAANQYYYRTQAIAAYVRGLIKLDPNSLIVLVSDHLPPLDEGTKSYKDFRYLNNIEDSTHMNRILIVENGKVVRHNTIHHYNVSSLIYDYLTGEKFCARNKCDISAAEREEQYTLLISRAVSPN